jgi:hypothetical protein
VGGEEGGARRRSVDVTVARVAGDRVVEALLAAASGGGSSADIAARAARALAPALAAAWGGSGEGAREAGRFGTRRVILLEGVETAVRREQRRRGTAGEGGDGAARLRELCDALVCHFVLPALPQSTAGRGGCACREEGVSVVQSCNEGDTFEFLAALIRVTRTQALLVR